VICLIGLMLTVPVTRDRRTTAATVSAS